MKVMLIADVEEKLLWDYYKPEKLEGVELIISCGDLKPAYLEFLVTMGNCRVVYVRGNHDGIYDEKEPLGCDCIEDKIYNYRGLRILGLGGSYRYKNAKDMYTEKQMEKRIRKLSGQLMFTGGFDILVTHAPSEGYGDLPDLAHKGFACFNDLMDKYHPLYMFHGHVHREYGNFIREREHPSGTKIINGYGSYILDIDESLFPEEGKTGNFYYDWYINKRKKGR
ncbi:MAG: metallophosphoesterase family protein [Solobacterium sp.]|nr:metallophosphoesterase family protein [Solobacterium sp.]